MILTAELSGTYAVLETEDAPARIVIPSSLANKPSCLPLALWPSDDSVLIETDSEASIDDILVDLKRTSEVLTLVLAVMDSDLSIGLRGEISNHLDGILVQSSTTAYRIDCILHAQPPDVAAVERAAAIADGVAAHMLSKIFHSLANRSSEISLVTRSFETALSLLTSLEAARLRRHVILEGYLREAAVLVQGHSPVDDLEFRMLDDVEVRRIAGYREVVTLFTGGLPHQELLSPEYDRYSTEDDDDEERDYSLPATRQQVEAQISAISALLRQGKIERAAGYIDDLKHSQADAPTLLAKSLCSIANEAKRIGNYELQLDLTRSSTELSPGDALAWGQYGDALSLSGQYEDALMAFDQSELFGGPNPTLLGERGKTYRAMGRPDIALENYRHALSLDTLESSRSMLGLAETLRHMGEYHDALRVVDQLLFQWPTYVHAMEARARILIDAGRLSAAVEQLAMVDTADLSPQTSVVYARTLRRLGRWSQASKLAKQSSSIHSSEEYALAEIDALIADGLPKDALTISEKSQRDRPWSSQLWLRTSRCQLVLGDLTGALKTLLEAGERFPHNPAVMMSLCHAQLRTGDLIAADQVSSRLASEFESHVGVQSVRAQVIRRLRGPKAAVVHLERAMSLHPTPSSSLEAALGFAKYASGDRTGALEAFDSAASRVPVDPSILARWAQAVANDGRTAEAIGRLLQHLKDAPGDREVSLMLARLYRQSDRHGEALRLYQTLRQQSPHDDRALAGWVSALLELSRFDEALGVVTQVEGEHEAFRRHLRGLIALAQDDLSTATSELHGILQSEPEPNQQMRAALALCLLMDGDIEGASAAVNELDLPTGTSDAMRLASAIIHGEVGNSREVEWQLSLVADPLDPPLERARSFIEQTYLDNRDVAPEEVFTNYLSLLLAAA